MKPILFYLGSFPVHAFTVFMIAGLAVGLWLVPRCAHRAGLQRSGLRSVFLLVFIAGWIGSRLFFAALNFSDVSEHPAVFFALTGREGVWFGGLVAGVFAAAWFANRSKLEFWRLLDTAAIPVLLGTAIGRIGCAYSACCFGRPSRRPWALAFPDEIASQLNPGLPAGPLHPVAFYESAALVLVAVIIVLLGRERHRPGQIGLIWIGMASAVRFTVEMLRGDSIRGFVFGDWFSVSQAIGMLFFMLATLVFLIRAQTGNRAPIPSAPD